MKPTGVFLDTSVLLGGLIDLGPASKAAQALFDGLGSGRLPHPRTAWHCCLEFYAVATRLPDEYRLAPSDAHALLEAEVLGRFAIVDLPARSRRAFLRACGREEVRGGRLYDAHVAEIAQASGARMIVTENVRHFASLERHGVQVVNAQEAVGQLLRRR